MKVAVASDSSRVAQHFGHCEEYILFTLYQGEVREREVVVNPGHRPNYLPHFLADLGVDSIIAGGMGGRAVHLFKEHGIDTIIGVEGQADQVIHDLLAGKIKPGDNACHH